MALMGRMIVLCGANNWDAFKLADRHMAERLTGTRRSYTWIPPSRTSRASRTRRSARGAKPRLRVIGPGWPATRRS